MYKTEIIKQFLEERRSLVTTNKVWLIGEIAEEFRYDHKNPVSGEIFYTSFINIKRESGITDKIPIMVSKWMLNIFHDYVGEKVKIEGHLKSFNQHIDGKSHLRLYIWVTEMDFVKSEKDEDLNLICLDGYLCKNPVLTRGNNGKSITNFILAVSRPFNKKTDYIPCVSWEKNSYILSRYKVGDRVVFCGKIQSREYLKRGECKTAYEVFMRNLLKV